MPFPYDSPVSETSHLSPIDPFAGTPLLPAFRPDDDEIISADFDAHVTRSPLGYYANEDWEGTPSHGNLETINQRMNQSELLGSLSYDSSTGPGASLTAPPNTSQDIFDPYFLRTGDIPTGFTPGDQTLALTPSQIPTMISPLDLNMATDINGLQPVGGVTPASSSGGDTGSGILDGDGSTPGGY